MISGEPSSGRVIFAKSLLRFAVSVSEADFQTVLPFCSLRLFLSIQAHRAVNRAKGVVAASISIPVAAAGTAVATFFVRGKKGSSARGLSNHGSKIDYRQFTHSICRR